MDGLKFKVQTLIKLAKGKDGQYAMSHDIDLDSLYEQVKQAFDDFRFVSSIFQGNITAQTAVDDPKEFDKSKDTKLRAKIATQVFLQKNSASYSYQALAIEAVEAADVLINELNK